LLEALSRYAATLARDIEVEEERTGMHDENDPAYPVLARDLRARERNLRSSITYLGRT
jgi:hypothetical protein